MCLALRLVRFYRVFLCCIIGLYIGCVVADTVNINSQSVSEYSFKLIKRHAEFLPRDGAGLVEMNGVLYLIGGWSQNKNDAFPRVVANDVWSSKDPFDTWVLLKPNSYDKDFDGEVDFEGRHSGGYLVYKDKIWILGGDYNSGHYQGDVWNSSDGVVWNLVSRDSPLGDRVLFHSFVLNDEMWVLGGMRIDNHAPSYESSFFTDAYKTKDGIRWERVQPVVDKGDLFPAGMVQGYAVLDGFVYIIGGGYYGSYVGKRFFKNDVYRSSNGIQWEQVTPNAPWAPRSYSSVTSYSGKLWLIGGLVPAPPDGKEVPDIYYSSDGAEWRQLKDPLWLPRHAPSVAQVNNKIILLGGTVLTDEGRHVVNDVYEIQINKK